MAVTQGGHNRQRLFSSVDEGGDDRFFSLFLPFGALAVVETAAALVVVVTIAEVVAVVGVLCRRP